MNNKSERPNQFESERDAVVGMVTSKTQGFALTLNESDIGVLPDQPANYGQADCQCLHCQSETFKALMMPAMLKPQILDEFDKVGTRVPTGT